MHALRDDRRNWSFPGSYGCLYVIVALLCLVPVSSAQVYLISGLATPKDMDTYASQILKVEADGAVSLVEEIASEEQGVFWAEISYDAGKFVVATVGGQRPSDTVVVDLRSASVVKRCSGWPPPEDAEYSPIQTWLINSSGHATVARYLTRLPGEGFLQGVTTDRDVPCDASYRVLDAAESSGFVLSGRVGSGGLGGNEGTNVGVAADGALYASINSRRYYLNVQVPKEWLAEFRRPLAAIYTNNSEVVSLGIRENGGDGRGIIAVGSKKDGNWSRVAIAADGDYAVRSFGPYVAVVVGRQKTEVRKESKGREHWRELRSKSGPGMNGILSRSPYTFDGTLLLFDAENHKLHTIETGEADSEILLVENGVIYLRVNDELRTSSLSGGSIGPWKLIAKDDIVRDVHWAFVRK